LMGVTRCIGRKIENMHSLYFMSEFGLQQPSKITRAFNDKSVNTRVMNMNMVTFENFGLKSDS
jgi:hypothetical protein